MANAWDNYALHDRKQTASFIGNGVATAQVTPTEHAAAVGIGMTAIKPTARDFSMVVMPGPQRVFMPAGSVWSPDNLLNHFYARANGVVKS